MCREAEHLFSSRCDEWSDVMRNMWIIGMACGAVLGILALRAGSALSALDSHGGPPGVSSTIQSAVPGAGLASSQSASDRSGLVSAAGATEAPAADTSAGSVAPGMGNWPAVGLCAGMPVTAGNLRLMFDPNVLAAAEGHAPLAVSNDETTVTWGDYKVSLDFAQRTVTVAGPDGAAALERDIRRCVGPGAVDQAGQVGIWRWSDAAGGWRYVDEPVTTPPAAGIAAPTGNG
jgi:hypothetical protein